MDRPAGLSPIDWGAPWFEPWRGHGVPVTARCAAGVPLHEALNLEAGSPVRFVPQEELPAGRPYESHIFSTGTCPTRDNRHDLFNGLAWIGLPRAKQRLNALQAAEITRGGTGASRGPVRDAITVFDENGALLHAPAPLWLALAERDWRRLFIELRPLWGQARLLVFGHALLEKLARPRKNLTAHVWNVCAPGGSMGEADAWLAGQLGMQRLAAKPYLPLPVLGVPGWTPENQDFSFYDDPLVFRPARRLGSNEKGSWAASRT